jgi:methanogenic corrinoid protein MtbC1
MNRVGELWECGDMEVYQERLGCEICTRILDDCRDYVPVPLPDAPLAIGATPAGDPYTLATRMAELVLKESGWHSISLGNNLPLRTLAVAVRDKRPRLVWLSVSYIPDVDAFVDEYTEFHASLDPRVAVVIGGRALTESLRRRIRFFGYCESFQQLGEMAVTLKAN